MKRWIVYCLFAMVGVASALEWNTCIEYWTRTDPNAKWVLQDDGQGVYIKKYNSTEPEPTEAELQAVEADALDWKKQQDAITLSDLDDMEERQKLFFKALVICINKRLPKGNKITLTELRNEVRALKEAGM